MRYLSRTGLIKLIANRFLCAVPSLRDANAKTTQSMGFYPVTDTSVPLSVGR
ncbi:MAG TPA: hypothetical protein V6D25_22005 [Leptolyngbyaceae cyanobacterium]